MTERENELRSYRFEWPERIPVSFALSAACYAHYPRDALDSLREEHRLLFPGFDRKEVDAAPVFPPFLRAGERYTDSWGCVWETKEDGIAGAVVKHPLADWDALLAYEPPSPEEQDGRGPINWQETREKIARDRESGRLAKGRLRHGHTFLTLTYLRGYGNLLFDMCDAHLRLADLIAVVEEFNRGLVERYVEAGVEWMNYPEDLGMQEGPMISPALFRRYIKPVYQRLIAPAKEAGCVIYMHSDGDVRQLIPDLLDVGVEVLNLQDLVNGLDWIEANLKGRVSVTLDIDRQSVTRYGTPSQIDEHIRRCVETLGSPEGGLQLMYGLYPGVPLENAKAVMDAMEKYSLFFS